MSGLDSVQNVQMTTIFCRGGCKNENFDMVRP